MVVNAELIITDVIGAAYSMSIYSSVRLLFLYNCDKQKLCTEKCKTG